VSGLWTDSAGIWESESKQPYADKVISVRQKSGWAGLYFGGVAFKYQRPVADLAAAARIASRYMDVVTTSGPGTGQAADVEKIHAMKAALGDFPLAIASGITPENVSQYLPCSDCYLVATGISRSFEWLDRNRVQALVQKVREYDGDCGGT
jgi:predicted TIM-barrel enzyme